MVAFSCTKPEDVSSIPFIEFKSFNRVKSKINGKDSSAVLTVKFKDGDGDVGLDPHDTLPPYNFNGNYYYNFLLSFFELQSGLWTPVSQLPNGELLQFSARVPNLTPKGQRKSLDGEISIQLFINNPFSDFDTIRFKCRLLDRALNQSNEIETPLLILDK